MTSRVRDDVGAGFKGPPADEVRPVGGTGTPAPNTAAPTTPVPSTSAPATATPGRERRTKPGDSADDKPEGDPPPEGRPAGPDDIPISEVRLRKCLASAGYWVIALPTYADRMQALADRWALAAGMLAILTGLAVWTKVAESGSVWAEAVVAAAAVLAGVFALVPRIKNYGELAGSARELGAQAKHLYGELLDLWCDKDNCLDSEVAKERVRNFEAVRKDKDRLRYLPTPSESPTWTDDLPVWDVQKVNNEVKQATALFAGLRQNWGKK